MSGFGNSRKYRQNPPARATGGFSPGQQAQFRPMVQAAWVRSTDGRSDQKPDRDWYERELFAATGCRSTTDCNRGKDFDKAMAHFEQLAGNGIKWTLKAANGDRTRLLYLIESEARAGGYPYPEYVVAIARTPFEKLNRPFPGLEALVVEDLVKLLGKLKRAVRRRRESVAPTGSTAPPAPEKQTAEEPF
jgi:hypothetical protein